MKVYRIYKGGSDTLVGWHGTTTTPYDTQTIASIVDPNGAVATRDITSIPSPFARIDLVKTAFAEVNREYERIKKQPNGNPAQALDGQTIYNKMVSDALDVGEIFFNLDKFQDKVEVIVWNPANLANLLMNGTSEGQKCYADALQTYWAADAQTYNFARVQNIYILNYKQGPAPMNIIGATSPATLFFCTANNLSYVKDIQFGTDIPFDTIYQPLYKRDRKYIEFLWWLKKSNPSFATDYPEVDQYLTHTFETLQDQTFKQTLLSLTAAPPDGLAQTIVTTDAQSNMVEVLGQYIYHKVLQPVTNSDFNIKSSKQPNSNYLVLPTEAGNTYAAWRYTTDKWGTEAHAPYYDNTPIENRRLPYDNTPQPYLTVSDFLEDTIITSPCELDTALFFDGNDDHGRGVYTDNGKCYLLPIKPLFFEFFSTDELKQMMQLKRGISGSVEVELSIPTARGTVTFARSYYAADANLDRNEGHIVDNEIDDETEVLVTPALALPANVEPHYVVATVAPFAKKTEARLLP